ncbi:hypothetical protein Csa_017610 [Cucumis sativus]|nr:hypothetical protein Csa_017610 [Cucumis sativus]
MARRKGNQPGGGNAHQPKRGRNPNPLTKIFNTVHYLTKESRNESSGGSISSMGSSPDDAIQIA